MAKFNLISDFKPAGDQPRAIRTLIEAFRGGRDAQTLLGATGTGKTFTMAHIIEALGIPTLVMSHNKTLAAQLFSEFKQFFPENAVGYFVSYYDYYQPEAYVPSRDLYIAKDASINQDIDRLRLAATSRLLQRRDVVIIASVSCLYGIGSPEEYKQMHAVVRQDEEIVREDLLKRLVEIQYERNDWELKRGTFRVRGDVIYIYPSYEEIAYRIDLWDTLVERISAVEPASGKTLFQVPELIVYPAKHFVTREEKLQGILDSIEAELEERLEELRKQGKLLEAQRLEARTRYDMELLSEVGFCPGIENYARHISGLAPGARPYCLLDYFPDEFLCIVDESHQTVPQVQAMFHGDRSRKQTLVDYGFRLPSALDNRPLKFEEWQSMLKRVLFVSATPGPYELEKCGGIVVEQIIRPTGLLDPQIHVRPARGQVMDVVGEARARVEKGERVMITTLTKRLAEEMADYMVDEGIKTCYLHSEIKTLERVDILNNLRRGKYDVIIGVNLLREGLDIPEISLVAILDADKEGFLRSTTSLIQTIGRTARNVNAEVILYADEVTTAMQAAIDETNRRREKQLAYNEEHGITPRTIVKDIRDALGAEVWAGRRAAGEVEEDFIVEEEVGDYGVAADVDELERQMQQAAENLEFEKAAALRDRIQKLKEQD